MYHCMHDNANCDINRAQLALFLRSSCDLVPTSPCMDLLCFHAMTMYVPAVNIAGMASRPLSETSPIWTPA